MGASRVGLQPGFKCTYGQKYVRMCVHKDEQMDKQMHGRTYEKNVVAPTIRHTFLASLIYHKACFHAAGPKISSM
jgi:hypothetical protein